MGIRTRNLSGYAKSKVRSEPLLIWRPPANSGGVLVPTAKASLAAGTVITTTSSPGFNTTNLGLGFAGPEGYHFRFPVQLCLCVYTTAVTNTGSTFTTQTVTMTGTPALNTIGVGDWLYITGASDSYGVITAVDDTNDKFTVGYWINAANGRAHTPTNGRTVTWYPRIAGANTEITGNFLINGIDVNGRAYKNVPMTKPNTTSFCNREIGTGVNWRSISSITVDSALTYGSAVVSVSIGWRYATSNYSAATGGQDPAGTGGTVGGGSGDGNTGRVNVITIPDDFGVNSAELNGLVLMQDGGGTFGYTPEGLRAQAASAGQNAWTSAVNGWTLEPDCQQQPTKMTAWAPILIQGDTYRQLT